MAGAFTPAGAFRILLAEVNQMEIQWYSVLTCPHCGHQERLRMPENTCVARYVCPACGAVLTPKPGDCCVFCSYGSVPCPAVQERQAPH